MVHRHAGEWENGTITASPDVVAVIVSSFSLPPVPVIVPGGQGLGVEGQTGR